MTYREKLVLYKQGKLTEAERKAIEQDIERHEAIGEYLMDEIDLPELEQVAMQSVEESEKDAKRVTAQINAFIHRSFVRSGLMIGATVLTLVLFVVFALPRIVDCFYYDPAELIESDLNGIKQESNRMSLDLGVYTELFVPVDYRDHVMVTRRGFGCYDLRLLDSYCTGTALIGSLERNELRLIQEQMQQRDPILLTPFSTNLFAHSLAGVESSCVSAESGFAGSPAKARAALNQLAEETQYFAYCTLDGVMPYDQFVEWFTEHQIEPRWAALCVKTSSGHEYQYETCALTGNLGMRFIGGATHLCFDAEKYPQLTSFSVTLSEMLDEKDNWILRHDIAKRHVTSMLHYVNDHPTFFSLFHVDTQNDWYGKMAERVDEDGLLIYGFVVAGTKDEILRIADTEHVVYTVVD